MNTTVAEVKALNLFGDAIFSKTVIVLISGKISAGKTTTATMLHEAFLYDNIGMIWRRSFAAKVKECAKDFYNWNERKDDRGRKLLQGIGRIGREYNKDVWVNYIIEDLYDGIPPDVVIIDDWRFPNEFDKLNSLEKDLFIIVKVRVLRNVPEDDTDISEISLRDDMEYDFVIDNTGTLDDLRTTVNELADYIYSL
jgi:hypothetical protein